MASVKGIEIGGDVYDIEDAESRETLETQSEQIGNLEDLGTSEKGNLVAAINEVKDSIVSDALTDFTKFLTSKSATGFDTNYFTARLSLAQAKAVFSLSAEATYVNNIGESLILSAQGVPSEEIFNEVAKIFGDDFVNSSESIYKNVSLAVSASVQEPGAEDFVAGEVRVIIVKAQQGKANVSVTLRANVIQRFVSGTHSGGGATFSGTIAF